MTSHQPSEPSPGDIGETAGQRGQAADSHAADNRAGEPTETGAAAEESSAHPS